MRPPVGFGWWSVMLENGGWAVLEPATKWSSDLQQSTLALTGLDGWPKKANLINWLVMSGPMIILTIFFKLLLWQTSTQPYFILKVLEGGNWDSYTWNYLNCVQTSSSWSCCTISLVIPDPFPPLFSIVHYFWQVFKATSCIGTELLYVGSSWLSCLSSSMWRGP